MNNHKASHLSLSCLYTFLFKATQALYLIPVNKFLQTCFSAKNFSNSFKAQSFNPTNLLLPSPSPSLPDSSSEYSL